MTIIYHSRDLDGYCSGAICKLKYPDANLVGYDYGKPIPWDLIPENDGIIMVDVSAPMEDMQNLAIYSGFNFTWIDHHESAIKQACIAAGHDYESIDFKIDIQTMMVGGFRAILQNGRAACEIAWDYLFPDTRMPDAVKFLGQYDTWRQKEVGNRWATEILPFQFGMRLDCNSAETFPMHLLDGDEEKNYNAMVECLNNGITILKYQGMQNATACKKAFETTFKGLNAICLNGGGFNSDAFKTVYNEAKHDIMMPFCYDGQAKLWIVSMYTTHPDVDCSIYAKEMGGGGHRQAAGFQVADISEVFGELAKKIR